MVQLLDIYFLEIKFRKCNDPRPCIVIHLGSGRVAALAHDFVRARTCAARLRF